MSFLFGGGSQAQAPKRYAGVQIQTSVNGVGITLVWGTNRIAGNLIDYVDFQAHEQSMGGKGGGEVTGYTYTATPIIALGQGPVQEIKTAWLNSTKKNLAKIKAHLFLGGFRQDPWDYMTANHSDHALNYNYVAYVGLEDTDLGSSPSIPNYNWEVRGLISDDANGLDCKPDSFVLDALCNAVYGAGFPLNRIGDLTLYSSYCQAMGFIVSPVCQDQQSASDLVGKVVEFTNSEFVPSQGKIYVIPYGDQDITDRGATYTAPRTDCFNFTDDDFLYAEGEAPVKLRRKRPADAYNIVQVEYLSRFNDYASAGPATAIDQNSVMLYGRRPEGSQQCNFFCLASPAHKSAQLRVQRYVSNLNTYEFNVGWKNVVIDPMDIGAITDSVLGLDRHPVRVKEIKENDNGDLTFTCEDYLQGAASIHVEPSVQDTDPHSTDTEVDPGSVSTPLIWEPPVELSSGLRQLWCAVAGTNANWGGCQVWVSTTGSNYRKVGEIKTRSRYGVTTNMFPDSTSPDTTNTLNIDLSRSLGTLNGGTTEDADDQTTLCYLDGEYIAYSNVTLTSQYNYSLDTYITRGLYGGHAAHSSGADFARIDGTIFKHEYDPKLIGKTLYVKFPSFNVFGNALEDISTVATYTFVPNGGSSDDTSYRVLDVDDGTFVIDIDNHTYVMDFEG